MKCSKAIKEDGEWLMSFKGDFFQNYIGKWHKLDETVPSISEDEIQEKQNKTKLIVFKNTKTGMLTSWQENFNLFLGENYKQIEKCVEMFLLKDEELGGLRENNRDIDVKDCMELHDMTVYDLEDHGVDLCFVSIVHEGFHLAVNWRIDGRVKYVDVTK